MKGKFLLIGLAQIGLLTQLISPSPYSLAIEKIQLGSAIKLTPAYYLPVVTGQEKGFFKENGLEVEWVPFSSAPDLHRAFAGGALNMGLDTGTGKIQAASRGIPVYTVSDLQHNEGVALYVLPGSPIKGPKDLKGARIGITRPGSTDHANAQFIAKVLGIEKDVKYLGTGGISPKIAALKAGVIDAFTIFLFPIMELRVKGEVREVLKFEDYRPKEWLGHNVVSRKDFAKKSPDTVRRLVKGILQSLDHIRENPAWAREKMKVEQGYSEEAARQAYEFLRFTRDGKVDPKGVENVRTFLIEFELVPKDKTPPAEELYTREFTG